MAPQESVKTINDNFPLNNVYVKRDYEKERFEGPEDGTGDKKNEVELTNSDLRAVKEDAFDIDFWINHFYDTEYDDWFDANDDDTKPTSYSPKKSRQGKQDNNSKERKKKQDRQVQRCPAKSSTGRQQAHKAEQRTQEEIQDSNNKKTEQSQTNLLQKHNPNEEAQGPKCKSSIRDDESNDSIKATPIPQPADPRLSGLSSTKRKQATKEDMQERYAKTPKTSRTLQEQQ
ncbi:hypothetical protein K469DRAFT_690708 [Zopfia rhizophila CBS 207.26]|uniref:Uncharacterized protein n=1 Tax=Zopfia rhizophila CBS 207.26 TaxID=1314779 RepID=A0A6A6DXA1_9PEZI|nr:hypothetical protein K469DRAFT_690708 [Zopfia rhizophila CBS 207.26]